MPTVNPPKRALFGVAAQSSSPSSNHTAVGSTTVLIPLVLSIILIAVGIGLGVFCFVGYRRRQRVWWRDFERRRALRLGEKDEVVDEGPGMWEIEVRDEKQYDGLRRDVDDGIEGWSERPVAVTYRRESCIPSTSFPNLSKTTSSSTSSTLATHSTSTPGYSDIIEPNQVEMTFLIVMPSPTSTPTRSRRTSPSSSLPDLYEVSKAQSESGSDWKGDEIPEVELATVVISLERDR